MSQSQAEDSEKRRWYEESRWCALCGQYVGLKDCVRPCCGEINHVHTYDESEARWGRIDEEEISGNFNADDAPF